MSLDSKPSAVPDTRTEKAVELMAGFAERTGLTSERPQTRYLWTDSFAVCNFLGLARATGERRYRELALRLVDSVHHTLGRHRGDDPRTGWISGLSDPQAEAHPTRGGLRIGKELPERGPDDPFDERLEWDRDGQYFVERMRVGLEQDPDAFRGRPGVRARLAAIERYLPLADRIESFWLVPEHRDARSWTEHRDINEVMLATSLAPSGCLVPDSP